MTAIERPGKIIAVHLNYRSRAEQRGRTPAHPSYFFKPASSVSATGDALERPAGTELLAFEGEIALIIGTRTRRVPAAEGWAAVSGVTAANDFGLYDLRAADRGSNVRSKGGDGFTPLGPDIIPAAGLDPAGLRVRTWVNGDLVQEGTTETLLFPFGQLVADLSQLLTLEPGDVILTGTPAGSSVVVPGDTVEVEVDVPGSKKTSGRLVTRITEGTAPFADVGALPEVDDTQRIEAWGDAAAAGLDPHPLSFRLGDELLAQLRSVSVATLSVQLRQRGYDDASIDGVAPCALARDSRAPLAPSATSPSGPTSSPSAAAGSTRRSSCSIRSAPTRWWSSRPEATRVRERSATSSRCAPRYAAPPGS